MITRKQFGDCFPHAKLADLEKYWPYVNDGLAKWEINTPRRQAAFMANVAHETLSLHYFKEIADGHQYEGRIDLGNTFPGDGKKFPGRGWLQTTGRHNYEVTGKALGLDLITKPELLEDPKWCVYASCYFWQSRGLNRIADIDGFLTICKRINGVNKSTGFPNGWADRQVCWEICKKALNVV